MSTEQPDSPAERTATVGTGGDTWKYSSRTGFDLTRGTPPSATSPHVTLPTTTLPITFPIATAALVIIDMQNFFLSPAFHRPPDGPGHRALAQLTTHALPAARAANLQVVWLNWGLTAADLAAMPAGVSRAFGFVLDDGARARKHGEVVGETAETAETTPLRGGGLGADCGQLRDPSTGAGVAAGGLLMRGAWNAALFPPLDAWFAAGAELATRPDVWLHKNRMSGLWDARTELGEFLEARGIRTLLFAGVNTDQCVCGTLTDAFSKGYDCVLLSDGCGTTSPESSQQSVEFNAAGTWGFTSSCEALKEAVGKMAV